MSFNFSFMFKLIKFKSSEAYLIRVHLNIINFIEGRYFSFDLPVFISI